MFPRTDKYDKTWVQQNSLGGNVLMSLESLTNAMQLTKGMHVLDLGCGRAISSIFLAKEFDVQVWAIDRDLDVNLNYTLIQEAGLTESVFPLQLNVHQLPFPQHFFDAVICVNSYTYFGTDDKFLPYLMQFLNPNGQFGITDICFTKEIESLKNIPVFLREDFSDYWYHIHSLEWWKNKFEKTGLLNIQTDTLLEESDTIKQTYIQYAQTNPDAFANALAQDTENFITFFKLIGTRTNKTAFLETYHPLKAQPNKPY